MLEQGSMQILEYNSKVLCVNATQWLSLQNNLIIITVGGGVLRSTSWHIWGND